MLITSVADYHSVFNGALPLVNKWFVFTSLDILHINHYSNLNSFPGMD